MKWTAEQIEVLKTNYQSQPVARLAEGLGRTPQAIRDKLRQLNLTERDGTIRKARPYTKDELAYIVKNVPVLGVPQVCAYLGRSRHSVYSVARKLGVSLPMRTNAKLQWSEEDERMLREQYPIMSAERLAIALGRTTYAVRKKASNSRIAKLRKWAAVDIEFLQFHYGIMPTDQIAKHLKSTSYYVRAKARTLGLGKLSATETKILDFLKTHLLERGCAWCAEQLGITRAVVRQYRFRMPGTTEWLDWENEQLRKFVFGGFSPQYIADRLNREVESVKRHTKQLGLKNNKDYIRPTHTDGQRKTWKMQFGAIPEPFSRSEHSGLKFQPIPASQLCSPTATILDYNPTLSINPNKPRAKSITANLRDNNEVWDTGQQQRFLEALALGLSFGVVYLAQIAAKADNRQYYLVIDGANRLRALSEFLANRIPYRAYLYDPTSQVLDGLYYNELPTIAKTGFRTVAVQACILPDDDQKTILQHYYLTNCLRLSSERGQLLAAYINMAASGTNSKS